MKIDIYLIIFRSCQIALVGILFILPLCYTLIKSNFRKGFYFTWGTWAITFVIIGILGPAIAKLIEKATGEPPDLTCGAFALGIIMGWLPGLLIVLVSFVIKSSISHIKKLIAK
jgi:MFS family permease